MKAKTYLKGFIQTTEKGLYDISVTLYDGNLVPLAEFATTRGCRCTRKDFFDYLDYLIKNDSKYYEKENQYFKQPVFAKVFTSPAWEFGFFCREHQLPMPKVKLVKFDDFWRKKSNQKKYNATFYSYENGRFATFKKE